MCPRLSQPGTGHLQGAREGKEGRGEEEEGRREGKEGRREEERGKEMKRLDEEKLHRKLNICPVNLFSSLQTSFIKANSYMLTPHRVVFHVSLLSAV